MYHGLNGSSLEGHLPKLYTLSFCNSTKGMVESRISCKRWSLCLLSISLFLFVLYLLFITVFFHSIYLLRFFTGILHSNFKPHTVRLKTHTPKLSFLFLFFRFLSFAFCILVLSPHNFDLQRGNHDVNHASSLIFLFSIKDPRRHVGRRLPSLRAIQFLSILSFFFTKVAKGRRSGVIRMDLRNILEKFSNAIACISMSDVKHQICCKFIKGEL